MADAAVRLRPTTPADQAFLYAMLHEANNWDLPVDAPRPPLAVTLDDEVVSRYVDGWGRPGDCAVVAEAGGTPVGACWLRLFTADHHGWGFVAADVPELGIAVAPAWRRRGIGTRLLADAVAQARHAGHLAISLDVMLENPARVLYERAGFREVATDEEAAACTMVLDLTGQPGAHQPFGT
jgi:ribosomal protein S18 acetylase RimI-like enzyme